MATGYQDEVGSFVNYENTLTPYGFVVRGPIQFDDESLSRSISFLGAAQSFGVWCEYPFPCLVANALSLKSFNLGHAGAGPLAFLDPSVTEAVNQTKLCVIQVMSGRSVSNRYMQQTAGAARVKLMHPKLDEQVLLAHEAYAKLLPIISREEMESIVNESLDTYISQYQELAVQIKVPKILLWISSRKPDYKRVFTDVNKLLNSFPHFINETVYNKISSFFEHNVFVASSQFMNRPLWSESTQKEYSVNRSWGTIKSYGRHYSHPYLHILASQKILEKIGDMGIY